MNHETGRLLKESIRWEICSYVENYTGQSNISTKWGIPLVGFANAVHPYILALKETISPDHAMPTDVLEDAITVIAYYVPFTEELAQANGIAGRLAAAEWALAYEETNVMFGFLNRHLIRFLTDKGYKAAVSEETSTFDRGSLISNWSHRHFAYAAGLGTFGLNNMLITPVGCCGRYFTLVTNLYVEPDSPKTEELCLYKKNGSCRICVKHCPVKALSITGYERQKCYSLLKENGAIYREFGSSYTVAPGQGTDREGTEGSQVCGKCITSSPCAFRNPK